MEFSISGHGIAAPRKLDDGALAASPRFRSRRAQDAVPSSATRAAPSTPNGGRPREASLSAIPYRSAAPRAPLISREAFTLPALRRTWLSNTRADLLSGLLVALALIPEAIGFSIVAGVDPKVGLYASFTIAVTIAFAGGRPGMISAATGAMAVVLVGLVKEHGLEYMFAATVLTGLLQIVFAWLKLARFMRFVPRSVMVGFVCALAIVIFT